MSENQTTEKSKDTWETLKELQERTEAELRKQIDRAAPVIQRSVGASVDAATKAFDTTMKSIGTHTEREQLELLKAYQKFLSRQLKFVEFRLSELDKRSNSDKEGPTQMEIGRAAQRAFWFPSNVDV